jgi:hypothetical protein
MKKPLAVNLLVLVVLSGLAVSFLQSCNSTPENIDYNPNVRCAQDHIYAEDIFVGVFNLFFEAIHDTALSNSGYAYLQDCSVEMPNNEQYMHFHYGDVDRKCSDSIFRRGTLYANFDGPVFAEGTTAVITTEDFYVEGGLVEASIQVSNLGKTATEKWSYSFKVNNSTISLADTVNPGTITYNTDLVYVWEVGDATWEQVDDDLLTITGSVSGYSIDGDYFSVDVEEDLYDRLDCFWIVTGQSKISIPSATALYGTINYLLEDGCNYEVHFIFNGNLFYEYLKH